MRRLLNKIKYFIGLRSYTEWQHRGPYAIRFEKYSETFETKEI